MSIDDVEPFRAGRLTNMPTASEVARKRKLAEIGKTLDWYYEQVEASRNEHGEPCCAECHLPEKKKLPGGKIKQLTVDTKNARLICDSCANKMYKAQQRAKAMSRNDRNGPEFVEQFWERNRAKLSAKEIAAYEAREYDIALLTVALQEHLKGEGWDAEGLPETIREFCEEVVKNGTLVTDYTAAPEWWKDEDGNKRLISCGGADALYVQFGYYAAIPDHVARHFFKFAEEYLRISTKYPFEDRKRIAYILAALDGKEYQDPDLIVKCSTYGCQATTTRSSDMRAQWFCPSCETARMKKAREVASRLTNQRLANQQRDSVRDDYGRIKDGSRTIFGEDGPYS